MDYALFSGGGKVVGHSALSPLVAKGDGPLTNALKGLRGGVHPKADEWVISASQEAAGECLALYGASGWVDLRLREAVAVEAVTLEHIHRYIAYDITSAPKAVTVLGWNHTRSPLRGRSAAAGGTAAGGGGGGEFGKAVVLGNFRYDIAAEGGAMQTFNMKGAAGGGAAAGASASAAWGGGRVLKGGLAQGMRLEQSHGGGGGSGGVVVDHVRFEVESNYGNKEWTCLYRLRVHGTPVAPPKKPVFD